MRAASHSMCNIGNSQGGPVDLAELSSWVALARFLGRGGTKTDFVKRVANCNRVGYSLCEIHDRKHGARRLGALRRPRGDHRRYAVGKPPDVANMRPPRAARPPTRRPAPARPPVRRARPGPPACLLRPQSARSSPAGAPRRARMCTAQPSRRARRPPAAAPPCSPCRPRARRARPRRPPGGLGGRVCLEDLPGGET